MKLAYEHFNGPISRAADILGNVCPEEYQGCWHQYRAACLLALLEPYEGSSCSLRAFIRHLTDRRNAIGADLV